MQCGIHCCRRWLWRIRTFWLSGSHWIAPPLHSELMRSVSWSNETGSCFPLRVTTYMFEPVEAGMTVVDISIVTGVLGADSKIEAGFENT